MMRGMYSMDRVMDTEFRGDHSDTDPLIFADTITHHICIALSKLITHD